jgi:hypothetical protein
MVRKTLSFLIGQRGAKLRAVDVALDWTPKAAKHRTESARENVLTVKATIRGRVGW